MLAIGIVELLSSGKKFRYKNIAISSVLSVMLTALNNGVAIADDNMSNYNSGFLFNAENIDKLMLSSEPKEILVDIYVNNNFIVQDYISHLSKSVYIPSNSVFMCLGIAGDIKEFSRMLNSGAIRTEYNQSRQSINYQVPQKYLKNKDIIYNNWQEGINGIYVNYQINARKSLFKKDTEWYQGDFSPTLNYGAWRLHSSATAFTDGRNDSFRTKFLNAERDINDINSRLFIGDLYTQSAIFSSKRIIGVNMFSDESMLPYTMRGYSPSVSGVASSNAIVEVRELGQTIYTKTVPAGPFYFPYIPVFGNSGELEIIITEANGTRHVESQSFGELPVMVNENGLRYHINSGKLKQAYQKTDRQYYYNSLDLAYGATSSLTLYGGIEHVDNYTAGAFGVGTGGAFGAISFDVTHSESKHDYRVGALKGEIYGVKYLKDINLTKGNFVLSGFRYASRGFRNFDDFLFEDNVRSNVKFDSLKSQFNASYSQHLGEALGALSFSLSDNSYWDGNQTRTGSINYNFSNHYFDINLYASKVMNFKGEKDSRFGMSISIPYTMSSGKYTSLDYNYIYGRDGQKSSAGVYVSDENKFYSVNTSIGNEEQLSANLGWRNNYGTYNVGYDKYNNLNLLQGEMSGALMFSKNRLFLSKQIYSGATIIDTDGLNGVGFLGKKETSNNGTVVLTDVSPYSENDIAVDGNTLPSNIELEKYLF
ncbi:TPA: hypothetical protein HL451_24330, partial [Escherichia coli]|nr:hypothetical protein [Escherichia coli]